MVPSIKSTGPAHCRSVGCPPPGMWLATMVARPGGARGLETGVPDRRMTHSGLYAQHAPGRRPGVGRTLRVENGLDIRLLARRGWYGSGYCCMVVEFYVPVPNLLSVKAVWPPLSGRTGNTQFNTATVGG